VAVRPEPNSEYVWESDEYLSEAPSPVAANGLVFLATNYGVLVCYDAKTGEKQWEKEIPDEIWSSPMVSDGKLYTMDKSGVMHIIKADRSGEDIAAPALGEEAYTVPAFADNMIYIRGQQNLYCIEE
jgi:outer membrane protein assembly factor BamB